MVLQTPTLTAEQFDHFTELPENEDKLFEFIGGEIVEVPSNPYVSKLAARVIAKLQLYMDEHDEPGHVTGEAGGYIVSGERYAPDAAYISKERQPKLAEKGYNPNPPEFAVEIVSPNQDWKKFTIKIGNYLAAGTILWVGYPDTKEVAVYRQGQPVKVYGIGDTLELNDLLPGFTLAVAYIFKT